LNPLKAIRAKCLDCSGDNAAEVRECRIADCALFAFRMGKNPFRRQSDLSPEEKVRRADLLRISRAGRQERACGETNA
jgi:hypothetical protein